MTPKQQQALDYLAELRSVEFLDVIQRAFGGFSAFRDVMRAHIMDNDDLMDAIADYLALDEESQSEMDDYEGRCYDRQRV